LKTLTLFNLKKQQGSVLILSLIILLVLTMLGVSSMSSSSLQEKMAGNFRDREVAFQAAEAALAYGENWAENTINTESAFDGNNGLYATFTGPKTTNAFNTATWWTGTKSREMATSIEEVRTAPRFTVEYRDELGVEEGTAIVMENHGEDQGGGKITSFKVTARGTGQSDKTQVILQSDYGKRL
jgi:type IV pilus assembly protein PilX